MRYYAIKIYDKDDKLIELPSSVKGSGSTYTSYVNGSTLPGALNIEMDIPLSGYAAPAGAAFIRIWGISLQEIAQSNQLGPTRNADGSLTFKSISVYGGMAKGLPLANPAQQGLLVEGVIGQAFGNWIGTDQTLDLIVYPEFGSNAQPKNLSWNWTAGTAMADAIRVTVGDAFPEYSDKLNIQISDKLVLAHDEPGYYNTLEQFAAYVKRVSTDLIGGDYPGVDIFLSGGQINVLDSTTPIEPKNIDFQDLIGQPTWIDGPTIQFKCVMRGDLGLLSVVRLPKAIVATTSAAATSLLNLNSTFQGTFTINQIRHIGNFRQPDASSWVSTFDAYPNLSPLTLNGSGLISNLKFS